MADLVTPGEQHAAADSRTAGHAWAKAGTGDWIVDGVDIADNYPAIDETSLDGFRHATTSDRTVTIAGGEAYIAGWLVRDSTTDVPLPADDSTIVYVGYDAGAILPEDTAPADNENVIIGLDDDFDAGDPRTPIYTFDTDGESVTDSMDHRKLQKPVVFDALNNTVEINANLTAEGSDFATEEYVDTRRYTDAEARTAVTDSLLNGESVWIRYDQGGHPEGYRAGPDGLTNYGYHDAHSAIYSMHDNGGFKFRNAYAGANGLDMFRVTNEEGNAWLRGHLSTEGVIDNSAGAGIVPAIIGSNESLPSDTLAGRIVYDPEREE